MGVNGMSRMRRNNIMVPEDPPRGPSLFWSIVLLIMVPPFTTIAGLLMLIKRGKNEYLRRKFQDYRHYAAIIGDRTSVSIREIATRLGKSTEEVAQDLQNMLQEDMIDPGMAYIDRSTMTLHLQSDVVETQFVNPTVNVYVQPQGQTAASATVETQFVAPKARPKTEVKPEPKAASRPAEARPSKPQPKVRSTGMENEDFEAKLREIRQLNDDIENELVSERIDRIGALTASIFRVVREKPERAEEVRKFMNYYLPTTLKLLKSYSLMEKQSYQGENIAASRKKIEDVLETLVHAFEQQQDKLFQSDALDVDTDISVLETMMASDGLTEQSRGLHL